MKRFLSTAIIALIPLFPSSANADLADPLWLKVIEQNTAFKKWIAKDVEQKLTITNSSSDAQTFNVKKQFNRFEKETIVYKVVSANPKLDLKKLPDMDLEAQFVKEDEKLVFSPQAKIKRIDDQKIDGRAATIFEIQANDSKVKLWVNGKDGTIYRREIDISIPNVMIGHIETNYGATIDGKQVMQSTNSKMSIIAQSKKTEIQTFDTYSNWF